MPLTVAALQHLRRSMFSLANIPYNRTCTEPGHFQVPLVVLPKYTFTDFLQSTVKYKVTHLW